MSAILRKDILVSGSLIGLAGLLLAMMAGAADTASVAATVTPKNISLTVADGTVAYGIMDLNTNKNTLVGGLNDLQTATNDGNVTETFLIRGQNSANWTLGASAGAGQYKHEFSKNAGVAWTALTTANQTLAAGVAVSGTQTFDLQLTTPTSTTSFAQQSVDATVVATE